MSRRRSRLCNVRDQDGHTVTYQSEGYCALTRLVAGKASYRLLLRSVRCTHHRRFCFFTSAIVLFCHRCSCTAPQSDSSTDFSTEKVFEIAIVKFGLRGVGTVDAGERFRCFFLGALLQSAAAVHSDGSEAGGRSSTQTGLAQATLPTRGVSHSYGLSPGDWKETVAASSPIFHDGPITDQSRPYGPTTRMPQSPS